MTTDIPTLAVSAGKTLRRYREQGGRSQATVARLLTALGRRTSPPTVTRLESGQQDMTLEEALLLALYTKDGLRGLLVPPFTIGNLTVRDGADLDVLLTGGHIDHNGVNVQAPIEVLSDELTAGVFEAGRDRAIAETLATTPRKVANAARRLYGRSAEDEIQARFDKRLAEVDPPPMSMSAASRAFRGHIMRAVTREIGAEL